MIKKIDIGYKKNAEKVLSVQIPSYKVEAEIIGSYDIPPLKDTVETLQNCGEIFFGYFLDDQLCGVVSVKEDKDEIDIHRLIVHPTHFRKGIAQELLNFISSKSNVGILKVATGSNNTPAVRFYEKNGFEKVKEVRVNPKITLSYFEKNV